MCAWRSSGTSNLDLLRNLHSNNLLKTPHIFTALQKVDRANYVHSTTPYADRPSSIGYGATISAPHMHVLCLELLRDHLKPGNTVLDVGSGSGYLTAVMGYLVKPGRCIGIEHIRELVDVAKVNVGKGNGELIKEGRGWKEGSPYDCIHVGAASTSIPHSLLDQLKPGGRMVIPVGPTFTQDLMVVDKSHTGEITQWASTGVSYVPLTSRDRQMEA
ncbi:protein-L-isoaspartate O-methyltransferase [Chytridium lagenaria]|nr:protein-L-isoaspartate O-methyltransferase [Chytridium lagenaria]